MKHLIVCTLNNCTCRQLRVLHLTYIEVKLHTHWQSDPSANQCHNHPTRQNTIDQDGARQENTWNLSPLRISAVYWCNYLGYINNKKFHFGHIVFYDGHSSLQCVEKTMRLTWDDGKTKVQDHHHLCMEKTLNIVGTTTMMAILTLILEVDLGDVVVISEDLY